MKKFYFLLLLIICGTTLRAQNYSVTANLQLLPPYSVFLSDYSANNADNLRLLLLFNDQFKDNIDIKLRFRIEGSGVKIQTDPNYRPVPYTLTKGIAEQLSGFDFTGYFNANSLLFQGMSKDQYRRRAALPDGYYRFCVQVFDYQTGAPLSDEVCTAAWFVYNDPPRINQPSCGLKMKMQDPQYLLFSWLPMHTGSPNAAFSTEYTFQLVQIIPKGRNPNDAMLSGITIYEQTTMAPQLLYTSAEPPLMAGEQYAWRVQAKDAMGRDLFKNNGYSEVCWFTYGNSCEPPENIEASVEGSQRATITWDASPATNQYEIQFREYNSENKNWYGLTTFNTRQTLTNLRPNTTYEYKIRNQCGINHSEYAQADTFRTRQIAQATMLTCGQQPGKEPIDSTRKLSSLHRGDEVTIQDFTMTILEATGGNGRFSGKGLIRVKLLNTTLGTEFSNIGINDQRQVYSGAVRVSGASLTLLPPDVYIKVVDRYNDLIAIGNQIDNGLGTASEYIDKGTEVLTKINGIVDDLTDNLGKQNTPDGLTKGRTDIANGVEAFKDGDTTKGKGLIGKGLDAISQAVNGLGNAVSTIDLSKWDDLFKKGIKEKQDSLIAENEKRKPEREKYRSRVKEKIDLFNGFVFNSESQTDLTAYGTQSSMEISDQEWTEIDKSVLGTSTQMKELISAVEERDTVERNAQRIDLKIQYLINLTQNTQAYLVFIDKILVESKDIFAKYDLKNLTSSDREKLLSDFKKILDVKLEEEVSKQ